MNASQIDGATTPLAGAEVALITSPESRLFMFHDGAILGLEQFRHLHACVAQAQAKNGLKRLLITSAVHAEGKTHVATNLALTEAREIGRKVLLVDADFRKPNVHNIYGIDNQTGLNEMVRNGRDPWKAVRRLAGTNLHVITAGKPTTQPLTASAVLGLKMMLDQVEDAFDLVILDSPPLLLIADVALLAGLVHGIVLVVRAHWTPRELVIKAAEQLAGKNLLGTVLTGLTPARSHYAYYYAASTPPKKRSKAERPRKGQPQDDPVEVSK